MVHWPELAAAIWRVIGCKEEDGGFLMPDTERGDTDWYNDASGDAHKGLIRNWVLSRGEGQKEKCDLPLLILIT